MTLSEIIPIVGIATTAFMGGLLWIFSSSVMPALRSIDASQGLAAMNVVNRSIVGPMFLAAFFGSAAAAVAAIALALGSLGDNAWLMVAGVVHLIGFVGVTVAVHLPLNARFAGLSQSSADLELFTTGAQRWTNFNHVRAAAEVLAVVAYGIHLA